MLCSRIACLFVHVPKTAGNAVEAVLAPHSDDDIVCLQPHHDGVQRFQLRSAEFGTEKHSTLEAYWRALPPSLYDRLAKVSVLRNTFDRALSHYFSPHRGDVEWSEQAFLRYCGAQVKPLRHFWCLPGQSLAEGARNFDELLDFGTLADGLPRLGVRLGVALRAPDVRNAGPARKREVRWSRAMVEFIAERYREEIELFGFQRPPLEGVQNGAGS